MKGIKIDNYTAKELMEHVVEYMKLESIQTMEMITLDTIKCYQKDKEWNEEVFDITFAENKEVLKAIGITNEKLLKEAESHLFLKMFARFLHKNRVKVFLLAENENILSQLKSFVVEKSSGVEILETATLEEHGVSDDMILNRINGVEADCVLAALPSPQQQEFIARNRMLVNVRIWVGLGNKFTQKKSGIQKMKEFVIRHFAR